MAPPNIGYVDANAPVIVTSLFILFILLISKGYLTRYHLGHIKVNNLFLLGVATVLFWRGLNGLLGLYVFPWNAEYSFWLCFCTGVALFAILSFEFKVR